MQRFALDDLMKFPIRIDHYDKVNGNEHFVFGVESVLEYAEYLPTVDAVEVVRCKKCRFCKKHPTSDKAKLCTNENWNTEYYPLVHDNDFCSYGEKREGE